MIPALIPRSSTDVHHVAAHTPLLVAMGPVCIAIAWNGILLRFYFRHYSRARIWCDDWFMLITAAFMTASEGMAIVSKSNNGFDWTQLAKFHTSLRPDQVIGVARSWYLSSVFYTFCSTTLKIAVGLSYLRIVQFKLQRSMLYIIIGLSSAFGFVCTIATIFQCRPVQFAWTRYLDGQDDEAAGHCLSSEIIFDLTYAQTVFSAVVDWTYLVFPIFVFGKNFAGVRGAKRVWLAVVFFLGIVACTTTLIRTYYISNIAGNTESSHNTVMVWLWSLLEVGIALLACGVAAGRDGSGTREQNRGSVELQAQVGQPSRVSKDCSLRGTRISEMDEEEMERINALCS